MADLVILIDFIDAVINIFKFSIKNLCSKLKIPSYFMQINILKAAILRV